MGRHHPIGFGHCPSSALIRGTSALPHAGVQSRPAASTPKPGKIKHKEDQLGKHALPQNLFSTHLVVHAAPTSKHDDYELHTATHISQDRQLAVRYMRYLLEQTQTAAQLGLQSIAISFLPLHACAPQPRLTTSAHGRLSYMKRSSLEMSVVSLIK